MAIIRGTRRSDILNGTEQADFIDGQNGNDTIYGNGGNDRIDGGDGDDKLYGGAGNDQLKGGDGNDLLAGGSGNDELEGGSGNDVLDGGSGSDTIDAGSGNDIVTYVASENVGSRDVYQGGSGRDTLRLVVTSAVYDSAAFQADLAAFQAKLASGSTHTFSSLNLKVSSFERVEVVIDNGPNQAPVAVDDSISAIEDTVFASTIQLDANDTDADGHPLLVSAGTFTTNAGGTIVIAADGSYTYTPPSNFSGTDYVDYTVSDGTSTDIGRLTINVAAVADAPTLAVQPASGNEDAAITLQIAATLVDTSESLSKLVISGIPVGATIFDGNNSFTASTGDTSFDIKSWALSSLTIKPPANSDTDFTLGITATSTEASNGVTASSTASLSVTVNASADAPSLSASSASGSEDSPILLDISAALVDTDLSENLSIEISGVPAGALLSAGSNQGSGVWLLTPVQLPGLTITPPANSDQDFTLTVKAISTESANNSTASTTINLVVNVSPAADLVDITATDFSGTAGQPISLDFSVALRDIDGSESIFDIVISGVPSFLTLSAGEIDENGIYHLTSADLTGLQLVPAANATAESGTFSLTIAVTTQDGTSTATTTKSLEVQVDPVAGTIKGFAIDGYVAGATVFADADGDGMLDSGEAFTTTAGDGSFSLVSGDSPLVMFGGVDISTGLAFTGTMSAVAGSTVVTPLTTLVHQIALTMATVGQTPAEAAIAAEVAVLAAFGLDPTIDLATYDPVPGAVDEDPMAMAVLAAGIQVQSTVTQLAAVGADSGDVFAAIAEAITIPSAGGFNLSSQETVGAVIEGSGITDSATVAAVTEVVAAANASIQAAGNVTELAQAAVVAQGDTTDALASTDFSDPLAVEALTVTYVDNLATQVQEAVVGDVDGALLGTLGADTLIGTNGVDTIDGLADNDILEGLAGDDALYGGSGDDTLYGGSGLNTYYGGAGNDTLYGKELAEGPDNRHSDRAVYSTATGAITATLSAVSTVTGDASVGTDTLHRINWVVGSEYADIFTVDGAVLNQFGTFVEIEGGGGDDVITGNNNTRVGYRSASEAVTVDLLSGTGRTSSGADANVGVDRFTGVNSVFGSKFDDTLSGSDSNSFEQFRGMAGNDFIDGRGGTQDRADYRDSASGIVATLGVDVLTNLGTGTVQDGFGTVDTLANIEQVRGSEFADQITGNAFNNYLEGMGGADIIDGGAGFDMLGYGSSTAGVGVNVNLLTGAVSGGDATGDVFSNFEGIVGTRYSDVLTGNDGVNRLEGQQGDDTLYGLGGNDTLLGQIGNDTLDGGAGDDTLDGGDGTDTLNGGSGFNQYFGGAGDDTFVGGNAVTALDGNRADYSGASGSITVSMGAVSTVSGNASVGFDTLQNIDSIAGTSSNDTFTADGFVSNQFGTFVEFEGGGGNDQITGNGNTRISYRTALEGVTVDLADGKGRTTSEAVSNVGVDTFSGVNAVRGSNHNDVLLGTDGTGFESFRGQAGHDFIDGRGGMQDRADYNTSNFGINANLLTGQIQDGFGSTDTVQNIEFVRGSQSNDVIVGNNANNRFEGEGGNDFLTGGGGNDDIRGGFGAGDTAAYSGLRSEYSVTDNGNGTITVAHTGETGADGIDTVQTVENFKFADGIWTTANLLSGGPAWDLPASDILITGSTVAESWSGGAVVGVLSVTDPDSGNVATYSLLDDAGGRFQVFNGGQFGWQIVVAPGAMLDYEAATSHNITVRATDSAGATYDEVITIAVGDVNEAPTAISFSNANGISLSGGVQQINTSSVGEQRMPWISALDNDQFLVTWPDMQRGQRSGQLLDANGAKIGVEFDIMPASNTGFNGGQLELSDGRILVYAASGPEFGRIISADGTSIGPAIEHMSAADTYGYVYAAALTGGGFVIAASVNGWSQIGAQAYDSSGARVGTMHVVNSGAYANSVVKEVVATHDGGYVLLFEQAGVGLQAQKFDAGGNALNSGVAITSWPSTLGNEQNIDATTLADGRLFVVWAESGSGSAQTLYGQFLAADGTLIGSPTAIPGNSGGGQVYPHVAVTAQGLLAVSWTEGSTLLAQFLDASGNNVGSVVTVTNSLAISWVVTPTPTNDGGIFYVWRGSDGSGEGALARYIDPEGAHSSEIVLNSYQGGNQFGDEAAINSQGTIVAIYSDASGQDGSGWGVFARAFNAVGSISHYVHENADADTAIGKLSAMDPDFGDSHTFQLLDDAAGRFHLVGNEVRVALGAMLDYETATSHTITVRATDSAGASFDKAFSVTLTNVNDNSVVGPTDGDAATNTVTENATLGTTVGVVAQASDADVNATITYSLTNDAGGLFAIDPVSGIVSVAGALDYETAQSHTITVRAASLDGSESSSNFTIDVTKTSIPTIGDQFVARAQPYQPSAATTIDLGVDTAIDTVVLTANFMLMPGSPPPVATVIVHNFTAGLGGDVLDISGFFSGFDPMSMLQGWNGSTNPFATGTGGGFARLSQDGLDTLFEVDQNGGGDGFVPLARLVGVSATALTSANFAPGFDPAGAPPQGAVLSGTPNGDVIHGTIGGDTITAGDGNDVVYGNAGNDDVSGGDGADTLDGGVGNDTIHGGSGNDNISGGGGADTIDGGDGDDIINGMSFGFDSALNDTFTGGAGNDYIFGNGALDGGTGNDTIVGAGTLTGGEEDDTIYVSGASTVDAGSGADRVNVRASPYFPGQVATIDLGADTDVDTVALTANLMPMPNSPPPVATVIVTNFTAGAGGDVLDISGFLSGFDPMSMLQGWDGSTNPFATGTGGGFARLRQVGADTLFEVDQNGGGDNFVPLARLVGVSATVLTSANFAPAFEPTVTPMGMTITGDETDNNLQGGAGTDTLYGLGGNDILVGLAENDFLDGGADNDTLDGGEGNDTLFGGEGFNILIGGAGNDTLIGRSFAQGANNTFGDNASYANATAAITATMSANSQVTGDASVGTDTLQNIDRVIGSAFNDTFTADTLVSNQFGNFIAFEGGAGNDTITGNGNTRVTYLSATAGVTVNLHTNQAYSTLANDAANIGSDTFFGVVNSVQGSAFDDTITGSNVERFEQFRGGAGNDTIDGGGGLQDRVDYRNSAAGIVATFTGSGTGTVQDGFGTVDTLINIEQIRGSEFADQITGDGGNNVIEGAGGADVLVGGLGVDTLNFIATTSGSGVTINLLTTEATGGDATGDVISGFENITGSRYADNLTGDNTSNRLDGQGGNDMLFGLGGDDTLIGGDGDDTLDGGSGVNQFFGDAGNDTINGGANNDTLNGGIGNDTLSGGTGNNTFIGGAGNDTLIGGTQGGRLDFNTADYSSATAGITAYLSDASWVTGNESVGTDTLSSIDQIIGTNFADSFTATNLVVNQFGVTGGQAGLINEFEGRGGNDTIDGNGFTRLSYAGAKAAVTVDLVAGTGQFTQQVGGVVDNVGADAFTGVNQIRGSRFGDTLSGSNNASGTVEVFRGQGGNDIIDGRGGQDRADYNGAAGSVTVTLGEGDAAGSASDGLGVNGIGIDTLYHIEQIRGSNSADSLTGNSADNRFIGLGGNDTINGLGGTDWVDYNVFGDQQGINATLGAGGNGTATDGLGGNDTLIGIENIRGTIFIDAITGDDGANVFEGLAGNDTLNGGGGSDILVGGTGNDTLTGGAGIDTFVFATGDGADMIVDFEVGDVIDLSGVENVLTIDDVVWTPSGNDTIIHLGGGNTITIQNFMGDINTVTFNF
jgi:Ca2+-binding RTX toxin-like protein